MYVYLYASKWMCVFVYVCVYVLVVYLQQGLFVQQHPGVPGVQVHLLVRGSQELQQHRGYPK